MQLRFTKSKSFKIVAFLFWWMPLEVCTKGPNRASRMWRQILRPAVSIPSHVMKNPAVSVFFRTNFSWSIICWCDSQVIEAVMLVSKGKGRFSSHILAAATLKWFGVAKLFPKGCTEDMDCIQQWSLRQGRTLQRLATWMRNTYIVSCYKSCGSILSTWVHDLKTIRGQPISSIDATRWKCKRTQNQWAEEKTCEIDRAQVAFNNLTYEDGWT